MGPLVDSGCCYEPLVCCWRRYWLFHGWWSSLLAINVVIWHQVVGVVVVHNSDGVDRFGLPAVLLIMP